MSDIIATPDEPPPLQKILAWVNEIDGLAVTLSGKREDIVKFWQNLKSIKELCQEEVEKQ